MILRNGKNDCENFHAENQYLFNIRTSNINKSNVSKFNIHKHTSMKNFAFFLLLFAAASFSSCKDNDDTDIKDNFSLTFRATYDGELLEKYKNYPYGDKVILFDKFNTYLSDIALVNGATEVKLSDIEWVNFTPDLAPNDKTVEVTYKYTVPDGNYTGIKLGYGVSPDLNAKSPADFPTDHPLYVESEYWSGWKSYIFTKVQGEVDLNGDGVTETNLFYHCGSDPVYNVATTNGNIAVAGTGSLVVEFDLKKLFTFNGQLLDLTVTTNQTTSHDASNIALGQMVMENFKNATVLK
ncbi:MAG: hypothetical protein DYG98_11920 [Haliscomenobacteraceae bacterium CHB4]|nr:hypothetical protein [Saprospiraceae bacterium]MCE7923756.1 hypothetical protein [Haliscomenobacteraceae bacterium CHB4]